MSLILTVLVLLAVGIGLWWINAKVTMDGKIKTILNVFVVVAVILWLLYGLGVLPADIKIPKVR